MSDEPKVVEMTVPTDQHAQLAMCPFCAGYGEPYLVQITEDCGDGDPEDYWQARCGACLARGGQCATMEYAICDWNDASLDRMPDQATRWPGSRMCNVRGSLGRERHRAGLPLRTAQLAVYA